MVVQNRLRDCCHILLHEGDFDGEAVGYAPVFQLPIRSVCFLDWTIRIAVCFQTYIPLEKWRTDLRQQGLSTVAIHTGA